MSATNEAIAWWPLLLSAGICLPFIVSGLLKLIDPHSGLAELRALGLPLPRTLLAATIVTQLGGSALLLLAPAPWAAAGGAALAGFTVVATLLAHRFWTAQGSARRQQLNVFLEHLSIAAALLLLAALHLSNRFPH